VEFNRPPFFICEVKRSSPSKGNIAAGRDPVEQASFYVKRGVKTVSVLTEPNYFSGSLEDLLKIKQAFPDLAVLRKDFLLEKEDILVSHRAGADALLLIASILSEEKLGELYSLSRELGMEVLLEVHDEEDVKKAARVKPRFTGINSRNLKSFNIDLALPLLVKRDVSWKTSLVFESGISCGEDALFALSSGFSSVLVGEAVMRNPSLISEIQTAYARKAGNFWERLFSRKQKTRPLVKICGITNREDAECAFKLGADLLGFIFAPSKHRAEPSLLPQLSHLDILKVGVVVSGPQAELDVEVKKLLDQGYIQAVQFHGDEQPENCFREAFPYYKALQLKTRRDAEGISSYRCPRVLVDAYSEDLRGGTGHSLSRELIEQARRPKPLWLAGGLGPHNVKDIIEEYQPELIDASSLLEEKAGKKSVALLTDYFKEIERAQVL
jgi:indole-3-glycerol phosphate synthase/phosphoribosylanthranilate isomerase